MVRMRREATHTDFYPFMVSPLEYVNQSVSQNLWNISPCFREIDFIALD